MLILARRCGVTKMRMWNISCNMTPSFRWLLAHGTENLVGVIGMVYGGLGAKD